MIINYHVLTEVLSHHSGTCCMKRVSLLLTQTCTLHREGGCILLTLLPGDSLSFDFGKHKWTNQLLIVTGAHQSGVSVCPVCVCVCAAHAAHIPGQLQ